MCKLRSGDVELMTLLHERSCFCFVYMNLQTSKGYNSDGRMPNCGELRSPYAWLVYWVSLNDIAIEFIPLEGRKWKGLIS